jgi:replicative DNA helicase
MSDHGLPHNPAAELACIAAIYARGIPGLDTVIAEVREAEAFLVPRNRALFSAMLACADAGEPIADPQILSELRRLGEFDRAGGESAIAYLRSGITTRTEDAARAVRRDYLRRQLFTQLREVSELPLRSDNVGEAIAAVRQVLDRLERDQAQLRVSIREAVAETRAELYADESDATGQVPLGFESVDSYAGVSEPGDLVILAGESGTGKTAALLSWIRNGVLAWHHGSERYRPTQIQIPALMFSGEMLLPKLVRRWLSDMAQIDGRDLRGRLDADWLESRRDGKTHRQIVERELDLLSACEIELTRPEASTTIDGIAAISRAWRATKVAKYGDKSPGLIGVDFLQLVEPPSGLPSNARSDEREEAKAKALKRLAMSTGTVVTALSQLTVPSGREGDRPSVSWLRGSKGIRNAADRIYLLHRPWIHDANVDDREAEYQRLRALYNEGRLGDNAKRFHGLERARHYAELGIAKGRDGAAFRWLPLDFAPEYTRFLDRRGSDDYSGGYDGR